jgi:hypothetical protein
VKAVDESAAERIAELEAQNRRLQRLIVAMTADMGIDAVLVEKLIRPDRITLVVCAPARDEISLAKSLHQLFTGQPPTEEPTRLGVQPVQPEAPPPPVCFPAGTLVDGKKIETLTQVRLREAWVIATESSPKLFLRHHQRLFPDNAPPWSFGAWCAETMVFVSMDEAMAKRDSLGLVGTPPRLSTGELVCVEKMAVPMADRCGGTRLIRKSNGHDETCPGCGACK